jgi:hypothetical protein
VTPENLRPILAGYRSQVEQAWSKDTAHHDFYGSDGSPVGQCGVTSAWLQQQLKTHGINATYCAGPVYNPTGTVEPLHCWLEVGAAGDPERLVIDLTADQLGLEPVVCATWNLLAWRDRVFYESHQRCAEADEAVHPRLSLLTGALT